MDEKILLHRSSGSLNLYIAIVIASFCGALILAKVSWIMALAAVAGLAVCTICFVKPIAALYILTFSMLLSPEFGERTTQGGGVTIRIDDFLLLLIVFSWLARMAITKDLGVFYRTKLNRPIFYYIMACVISTGLGMVFGKVNPVKGFFFVLKYFEYFVVYFMVVNHVRERGQLKYLLIGLFVTCFIVNIIGLLQIPSGLRVSAPFEGREGEPNTFGGYLVIMMAITMAIAVYHKSMKTKIVMWFLTSASFVTLLFTRSRSSYMAFVGMYLTLMLLSRKKILAAVFVGSVFIGPFILPEVVVERVSYTFKQRQQSGQKQIGAVTIDTSTSARLEGWSDAMAAFAKRPIFGHGVTGYKFLDTQYFGVLVYTGLVGAFCFFGLLFVLLKESWISYRAVHDELYKALCVGFIAADVGMMIHALGANTFIIVRIMEPFWFLAGLVIICPYIERGAFTKSI